MSVKWVHDLILPAAGAGNCKSAVPLCLRVVGAGHVPAGMLVSHFLLHLLSTCCPPANWHKSAMTYSTRSPRATPRPANDLTAAVASDLSVLGVVVPIAHCNQSHDYSIGTVDSHTLHDVRRHVGLGIHILKPSDGLHNAIHS